MKLLTRFLYPTTAVCLLCVLIAIPAHAGQISVRGYGAKGNGKTDDTLAFQKALDAAGKAGGAVAFVPVGNYLIKGHLRIPPHVTLEGVFKAPTARTQYTGSTLLAVEGKGKADGEPFIFLQPNSVLKGVTIFYPEQSLENPVPYPWTVRGQGDNCSIIDVLMTNPWQAVDFGTNPCGRHLIRGLYGQPLHTGIFVDVCLDCGRMEDVHFWPFWNSDEKTIQYTRKNATAFIFGRTDWEMVNNVFCLGYKIGFHLTAFRTDAGNAMITNSGTDACDTGILMEYSQVQAGYLWTNCQILGNIEVRGGSLGPIKFVNCGIFGGHVNGTPAQYTHAYLRGQGRATFIGCHFYYPGGLFVPKDWKHEPIPAIYADGNGLTVSACDFTDMTLKHIVLGPNSRSTVITGTRFKGGLKLDNLGKGKVEAVGNIEE